MLRERCRLHLPSPRHPRLAELSLYPAQPQFAETLGDLVDAASASSKRTAEQSFRPQETRHDVGRWRQQARLLTALTELAAGHSVKQVALKSGSRARAHFEHVQSDFWHDPPALFSDLTK